MSNVNIIRAWKDEEYRNSLTDEQRAALPANPAGAIEQPNVSDHEPSARRDRRVLKTEWDGRGATSSELHS